VLGTGLADGDGAPLREACAAAWPLAELTAAPAVHPPHSMASPAATPAVRTVTARAGFAVKDMHSSWVWRIA